MRVYVLPVATTSHRSIRDRRALRGHRQRAAPPAGEAFTREHPRREHDEHDSATSTRRRARRQVGGKPQIRRSHRDNRHRHASERKASGMKDPGQRGEVDTDDEQPPCRVLARMTDRGEQQVSSDHQRHLDATVTP